MSKIVNLYSMYVGGNGYKVVSRKPFFIVLMGLRGQEPNL